jgi:uncharacterized UBP type Zn finger protein
MASDTCAHLEKIAEGRTGGVTPSSHGCKECLASGSSWVHLRLCLSCGHVGCCDNSPNKHATKHFHSTKHPVIKSFEPDENWAWCYVDESSLEEIRAFPGESPRVHYEAPGS